MSIVTAPQVYRWREAAAALLRSPGYTLTVVLTLALTLGALCAVLVLGEALLWRPLPYPQEARLVQLRGEFAMGEFRMPGLNERLPAEWQQQIPALEKIALIDSRGQSIGWPSGKQDDRTHAVSPELFELLGAKLALGRLPDAAALASGAHEVLISAQAWQQHYGADRKVLEQSLEVGDQMYRIVGVLDANFLFPEFISRSADVLTLRPLVLPAAQRGSYNSFTSNLTALARVRDGTDTTALAAELEAIWTHGVTAEQGRAAANMFSFKADVNGIRKAIVGDAGKVAQLLFIGLALLLAISVVSLASLVLARAAARNSEYALREALGLTRRGRVAHVLTEMLLLMAVVAVLALWAALWGIELVRLVGRNELPLLATLRIDAGALLFTLALALLLALVMTALFHLGLRRAVLRERLQVAGKGATAGRIGRPLRQTLMAVQLALVAVLVFGAATLISRSLGEIHRDRGMNPDGYALVDLRIRGMDAPPSDVPAEIERWASDLRDQRRDLTPKVRELLLAQPGVEGAVLASPAPFSGSMTVSNFAGPDGKQLGMAEMVQVEAGFFELAGLRFLAGAGWSDAGPVADPAPAVINRTLADQLGGAERAIGQLLTAGRAPVRIVGVVPDLLHRDPERRMAQMWLPQGLATGATTSAFPFVLRVTGPLPEPAALERALQGIDARLQLAEMGELGELLRRQLSQVYLSAWLAGALALLGVVLALAGVFGASAYQARLRRPEFGLRLALGAWPRRLLREQVADALPAIAAGLAVAAAVVGWCGPVLQARGVSLPALRWPDALLAAAVLTTIAVLAVAIAAGREIRRSPWQSLRND